MIFGKKSEYIKFSKVISILEDERTQYHHASQADIVAKGAIEKAIKALKLYHIKNNPSHYMEWQKVFNKEAHYLLEAERITEQRNIEPVATFPEEEGAQ